MRRMIQQLGWAAAFATAMAYLEAAVVVYLRGLLNITNATVQLGWYERIEVGREAATLVMLLAVGWLAGRNRWERLAYGVFAFGWWDIWYYLWLKVMIDWPESFFSPDVLFLIPARWTGPVLAPALIAALMCLTAVLALARLERGHTLGITWPRVVVGAAGGLLALWVFMADALLGLARGQANWNQLYPGPFRWGWFLLAFALMAAPALLAVWPKPRSGNRAVGNAQTETEV